MDGHKEEAEGEDGGIVTPENAEQEEEEQDKTGMPILYNKRFNECLVKTLHLNKMKYQKATGRRELTEYLIQVLEQEDAEEAELEEIKKHKK